MSWRVACMVVLLAVGGVCTAQAETFKPLTVKNLPNLQSQHQGQRHVIVYWALTCVPCRGELKALSRVDGVDKLPITLVNTGSPRDTAKAQEFLQENGLTGLDNWHFAASIPARLRQAIDPDWYGALPRSFTVTAAGQRTRHVGKTNVAKLVSWLRGERNSVR